MRSPDVKRFTQLHLQDLADEIIPVGTVLYHRPVGLVARGLAFDATSSGRYCVIPYLFRQLLFVKSNIVFLNGSKTLPHSRTGNTSRTLRRGFADTESVQFAKDIKNIGLPQLVSWLDWNVIVGELEERLDWCNVDFGIFNNLPDPTIHPHEQLGYTLILLAQYDRAMELLNQAIMISDFKKRRTDHDIEQIARVKEIQSLLHKDSTLAVNRLKEWAEYTKEKTGLGNVD